ncbi:uncharacterized protein LOC134840145 [Symsagittifera roscoffensis]|uniref:uncharacterized protein LOC134840145 n=1 Tax=Symsagittifera roscoffensis TaxID=84072 RepID=UPI00307BBE40
MPAVKKAKSPVAAPKTPAKEPGTTHPSYKEMVKQAITDLKERKCASKKAIQKFIQDKWSIEESSRSNATLNRTLRSMLESKELQHAVGQKTTAAQGRFRLAGSGPEEKRGRPSK